MRGLIKHLLAAALASAFASSAAAAERTIAGATCSNPPRVNCPQANCPAEVREQGPAVEPKTGRHFARVTSAPGLEGLDP